MNEKEHTFEMKNDGREYIVTLHYPDKSKKTFCDIVSKLLKVDVINAMMDKK